MSADEKKPAIRPARGNDMAAVSGIDARITGDAKPAYWTEMFERFGNRDDRYFLLAEDAAGTVLGYIAGEVRAWEFGSPPCGWVFAIGVDPDARVGKVGTQLFDAISARMKAAGVDTVRTMIARDDELIMAFFRSQGMMAGPFVQLEMSVDGGWADEGGEAEP